MHQSKTAILVLTVFFLVALTNCTWPQFRFNANHSGQNALDQTTVTSAQALTLAFAFDTLGYDVFNSSPAVAILGQFPNSYPAAFIAGETGTIYAVNIDYCISSPGNCNTQNASAVLWQYFIVQESFDSSPAVDNGVVYVGGNKYLYALDATTLSLWRGVITGPSSYSSPSVANGVVYVADLTGHVYSFNASGCGGSPCTPVWTSQTIVERRGAHGSFNSSPAFANGMVYVGDTSSLGAIWAFNASTGNIVWGYGYLPNDGGIGPAGTPSIVNGTAYIGASSGYLYAFNATTGAFLWPTPSNLATPPNLGPIASSPAVVTENGQTYIYIGSSNGLYKIDANGNIVWGPKGGPIDRSSPAVANYGTNAVIFVGSTDGNLYAFDVNGNQLNKLAVTPGTPIESSPGVANQVVYVGGQDGKLYAFK
jgi:outer membrane protein assembly factor BamB